MKKVQGAQDFFQGKNELPKNLSPIVIADSLKTPENMGLILRVSDNAGCKKVILLGDKASIRVQKIKKTAQTSYGHLDWVICSAEELNEHLPADYDLVAIETVPDSVPLYSFKFPERCAFVVGNEGHGISEELLAVCPYVVHIPMLGKTVSMNVSHALAVVLFEYVRSRCFPS